MPEQRKLNLPMIKNDWRDTRPGDCGLGIFKINVAAAYLNTSMFDNVKHKWLTLDYRDLSYAVTGSFR